CVWAVQRCPTLERGPSDACSQTASMCRRAARGLVLALPQTPRRARPRRASMRFRGMRIPKMTQLRVAARAAAETRGPSRRPHRLRHPALHRGVFRMVHVSRLGMAGVWVALSWAAASVPASAQVNLAGVWGATYSEDWPDR